MSFKGRFGFTGMRIVDDPELHRPVFCKIAFGTEHSQGLMFNAAVEDDMLMIACATDDLVIF